MGDDALVAERLEAIECIGPMRTPWPAIGWWCMCWPSMPHVDFKQLIGQSVCIELLTQQSRTELRPWHGHVTSVAMVGSDGGLARYRLVIGK